MTDDDGLGTYVEPMKDHPMALTDEQEDDIGRGVQEREEHPLNEE